MGRFGELMVNEIYGNNNFEKGRAVELPKSYTIEEIEEQIKREKEQKEAEFKELQQLGIGKIRNEY